MSGNSWRWVLVLGLGAVVGMGEVFTDAKFPGWWDVIRHAGGGVVTAAVALQVTLSKALGINGPNK